jgi:hypothetical protein
MAELILSSAGHALGASLPGVFGTIGAALGRIGGAYLGRSIDQALFGTSRTIEGARLSDLHLQASTEGASMPRVFGRVRIAGQVIWAARFKEHVSVDEILQGGKGGAPSTKVKNYTYSLSFAVGLCEGEIARIGRVWANGESFDLSKVAWRLHTGRETQAPDPLIEAIEGADNAPAYRGVAYIVFEDLPLADFGNVIPQLSFEIVHPANHGGIRLEERVKGVCLIPGAGEFVYATEPIFRKAGEGQETAENVHAESERANLLVSLDQLKADFPNCETALLVVSWFGDDLRCGVCTIKPGVEIASKDTKPKSWRAGGVTRSGARLISTYNGAPAYGGTPSDDSVKQAIAELKARGYKVGLYPFLQMDVPQDNALPDPQGAASQPAYPWRGRIGLHPAAGQGGSPDKTNAASTQVTAFFGAAAPAHFGAALGAPTYTGPAEWSYRRFILHYAKLASLAGGVDFFIIGSEMRTLTAARDSASTYPAVTALKSLAADARTLAGASTKLTYAADWSEYFGHQPQDGSGDVFFHLDPLWADANIDAIGVDWYPPLSDWRHGATHADATLAENIYDRDYLKGRIEAGENYDWYYASNADRDAQTRTAISDGAYNEPWIYRAKDLRNFWSRAHYNRPAGVRDSTPTAWTPHAKPIWLIELGCPAVDKGANAPNLFSDEKSAESAAPPYSTGARDDLIQRRTLDAYLDYWRADGANNPTSPVNGKRMIEEVMLWCWDARPYAAFPARADVWGDAPAWRLGHWLNGRAGLSELSDVVAELAARAGMNTDAARLTGAVSGFVVDAPTSARSAIEPLMAAYDFSAREHAGAIEFFPRGGDSVFDIHLDELTAEMTAAPFAQRGDATDLAIEARVRFIDAALDYRVGTVSARRLDAAEGGVVSLEAPMVIEPEAAEAIAQRALADQRARAETMSVSLGPAHLGLEPGDRVSYAGGADLFEIVRVEESDVAALNLQRVRGVTPATVRLNDPGAPPLPVQASTPAVAVLDLPPLPGAESDDRPLVAVVATPWLGAHEVYAGASLTQRALALQPAAMGELAWALWPGAVDRWDDANVVRVKLYNGTLASVSAEQVLNGANVFAIESNGEWEIVQARSCVLAGPGVYDLSGFLRGRLGSGHAMRSPHPVGARLVALDQRLVRANIGAHEWGEALGFVAPPHGRASSDPRAAALTAVLPHAALRPWAPAHVRGKRAAGGDVTLHWVRCARVGGDAWGEGEPPLGEPTEVYRVEILSGAGVVRSADTLAPTFLYTSAQQVADFGAPPASLSVRVMQLRATGAPGLKTELTIPL